MIESMIGIELVTALGFVSTAMLLGYLGEKWFGAALLGAASAIATALCMIGTYLGYRWVGFPGAWVGLVLGMLLAGALLTRFFGLFIAEKIRPFIAGVWFGFCILCVFGYLAGGRIGLLTITLPCVALFWVGLYRTSAYILPLRDKTQHGMAFRSLLTFTMGTNYPYYFVDKDGKPEIRVAGNPNMQLFAGPGILYTDSHYAAYLTNGIKANRVAEPGLTFTKLYDLEPRIVDLRPQLRAFQVDALTKDGIPIKVTTFVPFRIDTGDQKPKLGRSFPLHSQALYKVVAKELTERKPNKDESGERYEWDGKLVSVIVTRIMQDIISHYSVDELCAADDPRLDPRVEIANEMRNQVREALLPYGIELVGGGISNLIPQDKTVVERRLDNWRTEWECKVLSLISEGERERTEQIQGARAEAEADITRRLRGVIEESMRSGTTSQTALALRLIDSLGEIVSDAKKQWPLPEDVEETLKQLRGGITEGLH